jgi:DNA-directed RNA polymerase subunit RPC12/RpoP
MDDESLGLMARCSECGGTNKRTGKKRREPLATGLGDGPGQGSPMSSEELRCTSCGHRVWSEIGDGEERRP